MNTAAFYRANKRITEGYIDYKKDNVFLYRRVRTRTPSGGYEDSAPAPVYVEKVTILSVSGEDLVLTGDDGIERVASYMIVAPWGTDIRINDFFTDDFGKEHVVSHVMPPNGFEFRAVTVYRGRD